MAKGQATKGITKVPNKNLYSRVSYLYQAATYLAMREQSDLDKLSSDSLSLETENVSSVRNNESKHEASLQPLSRRLLFDLRSVSLKGVMRMSPAMKNSICKNCQTLLIDGSTSTTEVENKSKGGKKPWADVLVRKCNTCGLEKRFPVAAERQPRRPYRSKPTIQAEDASA
jgi:ribonuclease P protein subunit RPR2